jgi:hypothetical protein
MKLIAIMTKPAAPKIHHVTVVLYAKFWSHGLIPIHAGGEAMIKAISTSHKKSFEIR